MRMRFGGGKMASKTTMLTRPWPRLRSPRPIPTRTTPLTRRARTLRPRMWVRAFRALAAPTRPLSTDLARGDSSTGSLCVGCWRGLAEGTGSPVRPAPISAVRFPWRAFSVFCAIRDDAPMDRLSTKRPRSLVTIMTAPSGTNGASVRLTRTKPSSG